MMARRWISSGSDFESTIGYSRAVVEGDYVFVSGTFAIQHQATAQAPIVQADRHPDCDDHRHPCPSPKPAQQ